MAEAADAGVVAEGDEQAAAVRGEAVPERVAVLGAAPDPAVAADRAPVRAEAHDPVAALRLVAARAQAIADSRPRIARHLLASPGFEVPGVAASKQTVTALRADGPVVVERTLVVEAAPEVEGTSDDPVAAERTLAVGAASAGLEMPVAERILADRVALAASAVPVELVAPEELAAQVLAAPAVWVVWGASVDPVVSQVARMLGVPEALVASGVLAASVVRAALVVPAVLWVARVSAGPAVSVVWVALAASVDLAASVAGRISPAAVASAVDQESRRCLPLGRTSVEEARTSVLSLPELRELRSAAAWPTVSAIARPPRCRVWANRG